MVRQLATIVLNDRQTALLGKAGRYIPWLLLIVMIAFRSNAYPAILAFGTCLAIGVFLSAATLIFLLTSQSTAGNAKVSRPDGVRNDLSLRILLAGLCAPIVVLFDIIHEAMPYGLGIAAAIALAIRLLGRGMRRDDIDRYLRLDLLRDILLGLIIFILAYDVVVGSIEHTPSNAGVAVWAVFYVMLQRAWQLREVRARSRGEAT